MSASQLEAFVINGSAPDNGCWVQLPIRKEEFLWAVAAIGVTDPDKDIIRVTMVEPESEVLTPRLKEPFDLNELNFLAAKLEQLENSGEEQRRTFHACLQAGRHCDSVAGMLNLSFIVCTHEDRAHVHNHIIFNSTALDCQHKFRNFIGSAFALRRVSDRLCVEHGLSIIENPKPSRGSYGTWLGEDRPLSFQQHLRDTIDAVLEGKPKDFDSFLAAMLEAGYEAKLGKHLAFLGAGQKKFIRCDTLKGDHTTEAIRERIEGKRQYSPPKKIKPAIQPQQKTPSLLIDIQAKIQAGKGAGYERFAKVFNLKQAAQTLIYLQEHGLTDYADLAAKTSAVTQRHNTLSDQLKVLEGKLTANAALQKQIVTYAKTRATYLEYRKSGYSKAFKSTHEADILLHQTAKKYFDEHGLKKLPTVASLRTEYTTTLEEKKTAYRDFRQARSDMRELLVIKANVDQLLSQPIQPENEHQRSEPSR